MKTGLTRHPSWGSKQLCTAEVKTWKRENQDLSAKWTCGYFLKIQRLEEGHHVGTRPRFSARAVNALEP